MRCIRQVVLIISTLLVLLVGSTAFLAQAGTAGPVSQGGGVAQCPTTNREAGRTSPPPTPEEYYRDDWRFGPEHLPKEGPIGEMVQDYDRLGDLPPKWFLVCYWSTEANGWWYPDQDGFQLDEAGRPIKKRVTLEKGQYLDLFGSGLGRFLAPAGAPYEDRAIPPSNLNTFDPNYPFSYHLYEVTKAFDVDAGPIRPWFAQPGGGLQYVLNPEYLPGAPERLRIPDLLDQGYLRKLN